GWSGWSYRVTPGEDGTDASGAGASRFMLNRSQRFQQRPHRRVLGLSPARKQIPQFVVAQLQQTVQRGDLSVADRFAARVEEPLEDQIVLQHPPPATPPQAVQLDERGHGLRYGERKHPAHSILGRS